MTEHLSSICTRTSPETPVSILLNMTSKYPSETQKTTENFLFLVIVPAFHVAKQYIQSTLTINKPNLLRIKIHLGLHYVFLIMPEAL